MKNYFDKELLAAVLPLLQADALSGGIEYETVTCPCCGHEEYYAKPGQEEKWEKLWPKPSGGKIRFCKPQ